MMLQQEDPTRFEVKFTPEAMDDMRSIRNYIEKQLNASEAARRTIAGILDAAASLSTLPYRNHPLSPTTAKQEVRTSRAGNYRLLYLISNANVLIFAVLYSKRDIEGRLASLLQRVQ